MSDGEAGGDREHGAVDREVEPHRQRKRRPQPLERGEHPLREREPGAGRDRREQQRFDEQLAHEAPAARAERQPDGDFGAPIGGAGDEQAGDVGAGDEQHQAHRQREHEQEAGHRADGVGREAQRLLAGDGDPARPVTDVGPLLAGTLRAGRAATAVELRLHLGHGRARPRAGR